MDVDRLITEFDRALRTLCGVASSVRAVPGAGLPEETLSDSERRHACALMRVNHAGEVCAQALYQGQAITARSEAVREALQQAAREETEHLAWTATRVSELGGRVSVLNPLLYTASFAAGVVSGVVGDRWNLGFLAETERQVEGHLQGHLDKLPERDDKSREIVRQMKIDEARHAATAHAHGAAELPGPVKHAMRVTSKLMTGSTYWV
ncbi:MAG TPA: 2-polyprenyl-3-methyl-6-methoxy-1,4-benzoquinone monooxygenase [Burkholderiales bacterium]|nr:2-polyprenyl-3-methyl-6-methoxy-1,4-benzoquinone monooxygenase [Burkholderiales bacterium]